MCLDDTTLNALDRLAEQTECSRNWLVAKAVEDCVALNAWQVAKIKAAADHGDFASDDEVARVQKKFASRK